MEQEERLERLVRMLCEESEPYRDWKVRKGELRRALRSLMNVRMPEPVSEEFLKLQDAFLRQEARGKGIVPLSDLPTVKERYGSAHPYADRISVWQGDITRLELDAIVNAANSQMLGCFVPCHGCIDNAIHSAAGLQLREECFSIMRERGREAATGEALMTGAYNLPCRHVLHTVGPIITGPLTQRDRSLLASCYESCLTLADENGLTAIAFCCISTGEFRFPNGEAAKIAVQTVTSWLAHSGLERVVFNVFRDEDLRLYEALFQKWP